jgi:hypothetical protein
MVPTPPVQPAAVYVNEIPIVALPVNVQGISPAAVQAPSDELPPPDALVTPVRVPPLTPPRVSTFLLAPDAIEVCLGRVNVVQVGAAAITKVTVTGSLEPSESVAVIVTVDDPAAVGVPDTVPAPAPLGVKANPAGNVPLVTAYVIDPVPPLTVGDDENAVLTVPAFGE